MLQQPSSRAPSAEELKELQARIVEEVKQAGWSVEELRRLRVLCRSKDFQLLLRYLRQGVEHLTSEVWNARSWEHFLVMKGEMRRLGMILKIPQEVERLEKKMKGDD